MSGWVAVASERPDGGVRRPTLARELVPRALRYRSCDATEMRIPGLARRIVLAAPWLASLGAERGLAAALAPAVPVQLS